MSRLWKVNGHLTITRLAGRLTPDERVEVAINTLSAPRLNEPSIISRSSYVNPAIKLGSVDNCGTFLIAMGRLVVNLRVAKHSVAN